MAQFYYSRTKKTVEIPDHLAAEYERRRWYQRLPDDIIGEVAPNVSYGVAVPEGTVAEVLAWAGDDPILRQAALIAEQGGKQRATLLKALQ